MKEEEYYYGRKAKLMTNERKRGREKIERSVQIKPEK